MNDPLYGPAAVATVHGATALTAVDAGAETAEAAATHHRAHILPHRDEVSMLTAAATSKRRSSRHHHHRRHKRGHQERQNHAPQRAARHRHLLLSHHHNLLLVDGAEVGLSLFASARLLVTRMTLDGAAHGGIRRITQLGKMEGNK